MCDTTAGFARISANNSLNRHLMLMCRILPLRAETARPQALRADRERATGTEPCFVDDHEVIPGRVARPTFVRRSMCPS